MSIYESLRSVHLFTVTITVTGFLYRYYLMLQGDTLLSSKLIKNLPHINDTLLLISGAWLAWMIGQYPLLDFWLTLKLILVGLYILLGGIALKRGKTRKSRIITGILAVVTVISILLVAHYRHLLSFQR